MTRATVITGSTRASKAAPGSAQPSCGKPPAGSQPRLRAKTAIRIMPSQKTGTAMPSCETALSAAPYQVRERYAARNPAGTATSTASRKAAPVSGSVTSSRAVTSGATGRELTKEVPRSPVASWESQWTNCSGTGLSVPMACRAASICSGVAPTEVSALAGSPGSVRRSRKSTTLARASETSRKPRRRSR